MTSMGSIQNSSNPIFIHLQEEKKGVSFLIDEIIYIECDGDYIKVFGRKYECRLKISMVNFLDNVI